MNEEVTTVEAQEEDKEEAVDATAEAIFNELEQSDKSIIHPFVIQGKTYHFKVLSLAELLALNGKCVRTNKGQIVNDYEHEETMKVLFSLHLCIVKSSSDTSPLFTLKQAEALTKNALANVLLIDLLAYIVALNPDLKNG